MISDLLFEINFSVNVVEKIDSHKVNTYVNINNCKYCSKIVSCNVHTCINDTSVSETIEK